MADNETILRTLWDAMKVDKFTQDTVLECITEAAKAPPAFGPMIRDGMLPKTVDLLVSAPGRVWSVVQTFDEYEPALKFRDVLEYQMGYCAMVRAVYPT